MKKFYIFLIAILIIIIIVSFLKISGVFKKQNISSNDILENKENTNIVKTNIIDNNNNTTKKPIEVQISSFSTEIKDNSPGRLENIRITCDILNDTVINPSETFSFNEIVGQPSIQRGYKEATIIIDGEHETGIGGGNCQVSSTLYNAVLEVPSLTIVERHAHGGGGVTYVPKDKDAAISYGSLDLKFKNENNYKIKIKLETDDKNITASILKLEEI